MVASSVARIYLQPAGLCLSEEPLVVETVLGSCVAVTLWDPVTGAAAVSHCVYPAPAGQPEAETSRYVSLCVPRMIEWMRRQGAGPERLQAKLFGGANGFVPERGGRTRPVGLLNVEEAARRLEAAGLRILASQTGGRQGRKLVFSTLTGEAWVKLLGSMAGGKR